MATDPALFGGASGARDAPLEFAPALAAFLDLLANGRGLRLRAPAAAFRSLVIGAAQERPCAVAVAWESSTHRRRARRVRLRSGHRQAGRRGQAPARESRHGSDGQLSREAA